MSIPFPKATSAQQQRQPPSSSSSSSSSISYPPSDDSDDPDQEALLIQEEWEESLRQLELVVSIIILPFFGKWYGRRAAYWAYERYQLLGSMRLFFGF